MATRVADVGAQSEAGERERRLAGLTRKRIKRRDAAAQRDARTLLESVEDVRDLTLQSLRELMRDHDLPVVSLYLATAPTDPDWPKPAISLFHSMRHEELSKREDVVGGLSQTQREALDVDLRDVETFLREFDPQGTQGLAVFKSGAQLNRVVRLPIPMADRMVIEGDPYVTPLEAILEEERRALVVFIEKDQARLLLHHFGRQSEVEHVRSFVPSDTVDRSRPNKVQRHRQTHRHWHMRDVVNWTRGVFESQPCQALVLAGPEPELSIFRDMLPQALRRAVIGTLQPSTHWTARDWEGAVEDLLHAQRAKEEADALKDLGFHEGHGRLAKGLRDVLDTQNDFMVQELYVASRLEHPGYACRRHHFLSLEPGRCPYCGIDLMHSENVVDELVEVARLHGVDLMLVRHRWDLLEDAGLVAAVTYPLETEPG